MAVDDVLEGTIGIVADAAVVVEDHHLAILCCIGLPSGELRDIGIAIVGKLRPDTAHQVGQSQIVFRRSWQVVLGAMQGVEAELQFVTVDGAVVQR